jgi:hypothetical protein
LIKWQTAYIACDKTVILKTDIHLGEKERGEEEKKKRKERHAWSFT